jgi:putative membrane protein
MFEIGFLGTKAPMFMDIVTLIVVLLPFLLYGSIFLAKQKKYRLHKQTQVALFIITLFVILFFEYGVRVDGGIEKYLTYTDISDSFVIGFLTFHITIATVTIFLWGRLFYLSLKALKAGELPGKFSIYHKKLANITAIAIILTAITGFGVYFILFI